MIENADVLDEYFEEGVQRRKSIFGVFSLTIFALESKLTII